MNPIFSNLIMLIARILLAAIFLWSGYGKVMHFDYVLADMVKHGVPVANVALMLTIAVELLASSLLVLGWKARIAALALFVWMIPVTYLYHAYWAVPAAEQYIQQIMFMKNLAIMGGLLMIASCGTGNFSLSRK